MILNDIFKEFLHEKELAGLSSATLKDYHFCLIRFLRLFGEMESQMLTYEMTGNYILTLHRSKLSKATVSTYIRNLRIFLSFASARYGLPFHPRQIKVPKSPKKVVHIYSNSEIRLIFDSVSASVPWLTARNRFMVALMLDSGIRQSEVCGLLWKNIDLSRHVMKVKGKGNKERFVPLGNVSLYLMNCYMSLCPYHGLPYVFCGRTGGQLTQNAVRLFTGRLQAKLPFEFSSHRLRHNFATNYCIDMFRKTGNTGVYDLSIIMGHESLETTRKYEHFAHELLAVENSISHLDNVYRKEEK